MVVGGRRLEGGVVVVEAAERAFEMVLNYHALAQRRRVCAGGSSGYKGFPW